MRRAERGQKRHKEMKILRRADPAGHFVYGWGCGERVEGNGTKETQIFGNFGGLSPALAALTWNEAASGSVSTRGAAPLREQKQHMQVSDERT